MRLLARQGWQIQTYCRTDTLARKRKCYKWQGRLAEVIRAADKEKCATTVQLLNGPLMTVWLYSILQVHKVQLCLVHNSSLCPLLVMSEISQGIFALSIFVWELHRAHWFGHEVRQRNAKEIRLIHKIKETTRHPVRVSIVPSKPVNYVLSQSFRLDKTPEKITQQKHSIFEEDSLTLKLSADDFNKCGFTVPW